MKRFGTSQRSLKTLQQTSGGVWASCGKELAVAIVSLVHHRLSIPLVVGCYHFVLNVGAEMLEVLKCFLSVPKFEHVLDRGGLSPCSCLLSTTVVVAQC